MKENTTNTTMQIGSRATGAQTDRRGTVKLLVNVFPTREQFTPGDYFSSHLSSLLASLALKVSSSPFRRHLIILTSF